MLSTPRDFMPELRQDPQGSAVAPLPMTIPYPLPFPSETRPTAEAPATSATECPAEAHRNWDYADEWAKDFRVWYTRRARGVDPCNDGTETETLDGADTKTLEALAAAHDGMPTDYAETWFADTLAKDKKA